MAGGKVVAAIDHHIGLRRQRGEALAADPLGERGDLHFGIDRGKRGARGVDLLFPDGIGAMHDLALEIGEIDGVAVAERNAAHAGGSEIERNR
ncbi:hypothetical protein D3C83_29140 [compost metagenome]